MVEKFQRGEVPIFIGSKAAATGITLTRARHLCFIERYWTSAEEEQAEDRIRRIGQKRPTKIWMLHAEGTVDDRIDEIIARKRRMVHRVIGGEDIRGTPEETVHKILANWTQHSLGTVVKGKSYLGLVKSLPPLPDPKETLQIICKGDRWSKKTVKEWAKMNKYPCPSISKSGGFYRILVNPPSRFVHGTFKRVKIAKDIHIVVGTRKPKIRRPKRRTPLRRAKPGRRRMASGPVWV